MNIEQFFDGIEDNDAFGFCLDDNGRLVPIKEPCYALYTSDIYPFVVLEEELRALNHACFSTAANVLREIGQAKEHLRAVQAAQDLRDPLGFTQEEYILSARAALREAEQQGEDAARRLIVSLYAFTERTLGKIYRDLRQDAGPMKHRGAKLYGYLEAVFGQKIEAIFAGETRILEILDEACKIRNDQMHGTFVQNEANGEFEHQNRVPSFTLPELIDAISRVLYASERKYMASGLEPK